MVVGLVGAGEVLTPVRDVLTQRRTGGDGESLAGQVSWPSAGVGCRLAGPVRRTTMSEIDTVARSFLEVPLLLFMVYVIAVGVAPGSRPEAVLVRDRQALAAAGRADRNRYPRT